MSTVAPIVVDGLTAIDAKEEEEDSAPSSLAVPMSLKRGGVRCISVLHSPLVSGQLNLDGQIKGGSKCHLYTTV